jgi:hypothetical protein
MKLVCKAKYRNRTHNKSNMLPARGNVKESRRLSNRESDWNLPGGSGLTGSRTRRDGKRKEPPPPPSSSSSSSSNSACDMEDEDDETEEEDEEAEMKLWQKEKPPHKRVIMEVLHVHEAFDKFAKCPECMGPLVLDLTTVCIATSIGISCRNPNCKFMSYSPEGGIAETTMHQGNNFKRMTDYALNVLYVVGFISMGDVHTDAGRLLGLCGLPNDTTMKGQSFSIIEERICPFIHDLASKILLDNVIEEARLLMEEDNNGKYFAIWKASLSDDTIVLDPNKLAKVDASYNMAWQQKGSGHQYKSQWGHGSMFGSITRRIIGLVVKSKMCGKCSAARKKNPDLDHREHEGRCWKSHTGTSGSMESAGCLELVVEMYDKHHVIIRRLCCDDDSSNRADYQWSNTDYMLNNNTDELPLVPKRVGINKGKMQLRPD